MTGGRLPTGDVTLTDVATHGHTPVTDTYEQREGLEAFLNNNPFFSPFLFYCFCDPGLPQDPRTRRAWLNPTTDRDTHGTSRELSIVRIPNVQTFVQEEVRKAGTLRGNHILELRWSEPHPHSGFTLGL